MPDAQPKRRGRPPNPPGHIPPGKVIGYYLPRQYHDWLSEQPEGRNAAMRKAVELLMAARK